ncbi:MAG: hypothetical protein AAF609_19750 [Cyanobacteria bacterium P01_C01_bin.120]
MSRATYQVSPTDWRDFPASICCRDPVTLPKLPPAPLQIVSVMLEQHHKYFNKYKYLFSIGRRPVSLKALWFWKLDPTPVSQLHLQAVG